MSYKLYIDDVRTPRDPGDWFIVRTVDEAKALINEIGFPNFISFDHDLGNHKETGFDFAKWLVQQDQDYQVLGEDFTYFVHSANPIGAANIIGLMEGWLKFKREQ